MDYILAVRLIVVGIPFDDVRLLGGKIDDEQQLTAEPGGAKTRD